MAFSHAEPDGVSLRFCAPIAQRDGAATSSTVKSHAISPTATRLSSRRALGPQPARRLLWSPHRESSASAPAPALYGRRGAAVTPRAGVGRLQAWQHERIDALTRHPRPGAIAVCAEAVVALAAVRRSRRYLTSASIRPAPSKFQVLQHARRMIVPGMPARSARRLQRSEMASDSRRAIWRAKVKPPGARASSWTGDPAPRRRS